MKSHYTRLVYWSDEDQCYLGSIPELSDHPLCHADSQQEVFSQLDDIEPDLIKSFKNLPPFGVTVIASKPRRNWQQNNNIATIRASLNMTQREFAAKIGASLSTLQKWETGERTPSGTALRLLNIISKEPSLLVQ